jgi:hypothetical protein
VRTLLGRQRLASKDPKAAFEHSRVALRRSPYSVDLLSLHVRILAANQRYGEAERLEKNVERLLGEACTLTVDAPPRRVTCADYLRESWAATGCAR